MQTRNSLNTKYTIAISALLCFLFSVQIIIISVYTHSHVLDNGEIVSHAHLYDKSKENKPFKSHHHSKSEILFLEQLNVLYPLIFALVAILLSVKKVRYNTNSDSDYIPVRLKIHLGRSPPVS